MNFRTTAVDYLAFLTGSPQPSPLPWRIARDEASVRQNDERQYGKDAYSRMPRCLAFYQSLHFLSVASDWCSPNSWRYIAITLIDCPWRTRLRTRPIWHHLKERGAVMAAASAGQFRNSEYPPGILVRARNLALTWRSAVGRAVAWVTPTEGR